MTRPPAAGEALASAFALLEGEAPAAFAWMGAELRGLRIRCVVGDEEFFVLGAERPCVDRDPRQPVQVDVRAAKGAILDLIDGETDFVTAIRARRVRLTADIGLMVRLSRAQRAFAEGASRSRGMRELLRVYRES